MRNLLCWLILLPIGMVAQNDSIVSNSLRIKSAYPETTSGISFSPQQLILPGVLLAAGIYGTVDGRLDEKIRDAAVKKDVHTSADDYLWALPPASVYVFNWCGIRGKHNFVDRSVILGTAGILAAGTTYTLKSVTGVERPDGSNDQSFPSMHTALAFVGAEFMYQEYKDQSIWYGVGGYAIATCTGALRIYNNKHWFSDVLAGAGIGILSTKAAYWLYPEIRKWYKGTKLDHAMIVPFASVNGGGLSLSARF